eukprot:CAMPEP_0117537166 /NCGR_PEP_ID=MMETSP0784-20121206/41825_1 /TAXON_ID=39447 /ORGANISM="" /LENGTH=262 /DNA_ID=CAMNT_0005333745 /DNA_START=184 /DNA_END=972 /DNA_ORIENTATION=-
MDIALKPPQAVRKLCAVTPASMQRLRSVASRLPEDRWSEPAAYFGGVDKVNYTHVSFHFPVTRNKPYSEYSIYPVAQELRPWIEPILLDIISRYNYSDEPLPPAPGCLDTSIPRLMFARLGPRTKQNAHIDRGFSSIVPHKIHVPLTDGDGDSALYLADVPESDTLKGKGKPRVYESLFPHRLAAGYAYEVDNLRPHYAENWGNAERLHLIFEFLPHNVSGVHVNVSAPTTNSNKNKDMSAAEHETRRVERDKHWEDFTLEL